MLRWQDVRRQAGPLSALTVLVLAAVGIATACPAAGETRAEQTRLIDCPTAGLVDRGQFALGMRLWGDGGLLARVDAGILTRLNIGVSYGGSRIIGNDAIDWYPRLEACARYRAVQESRALPALVVGYETQGYGQYAAKRYQIKARGLFLSVSKNYLHPLGQIGFHGGASLGREDADGDGDPTFWTGIDATINDELTVVGEYDLGLNDDALPSLGQGKGYLNAGISWAVAPDLVVSAYLKDLLGNTLPSVSSDISRELSVTYSEAFR